jgi:hypothetical protein
VGFGVWCISAKSTLKSVLPSLDRDRCRRNRLARALAAFGLTGHKPVMLILFYVGLKPAAPSRGAQGEAREIARQGVGPGSNTASTLRATPRPSSRSVLAGAQGIVSKHREHPYRSGQSKVWLKIKNPAARDEEP